MFLFFYPIFLLFFWQTFSSVVLPPHLYQLTQIEIELQAIKLQIEKDYSLRCKAQCLESYDSCTNILPDFKCNSNYRPLNCPCSSPNLQLTTDDTILKLSDQIPPFTDRYSQNSRELICSTSYITDTFKDFRKKIPSSKWIYIGSYNGILRVYPGIDLCNEKYDPRLRSWYVGGIIPSKNVILIIDLSESDKINKLDNIKNASLDIVNQINFMDSIGIVIVHDQASNFSSQLIPANYENKKIIRDFISNFTLNGTSNFENGINLAYDIIKNSKNVKNITESNFTIFIHIADGGDPKNGEKNTTILSEKINASASSSLIKPIYFIYSIGYSSFYDKLSCSLNGIYEEISTYNDLRTAMRNIFSYLSSGYELKNVAWSEPYEDLNGLGKIITASLPFYDMTGKNKFLLGVLAVDILFEELLKYESYDSLLNIIKLKNMDNNPVFNDICLEDIRKIKCNKTIEPCKQIALEPQLCSTFTTNWWKEGAIVEIKNHTKCCGNDICSQASALNNAIIGIVVGVIVGILFFIACCLHFKQKKEKKPDEKNDNEREMSPVDNNRYTARLSNISEIPLDDRDVRDKDDNKEINNIIKGINVSFGDEK